MTKNKILYFGNYGSAFEHGIASRFILDTLDNTMDLYIRPIYLEGEQIDTSIYKNLEKKPIRTFDYCIQHCDLDLMCVPALKTHNIAIPTNYTNTENLSILKHFDSVLVDNLDIYNKLVKDLKHKNARIFKYNKPIADPNTYDLGLFTSTKKFYYVGNYHANQHNIQKIIVAFNLAFRTETSASLTLFINDHHKYQKEIEDYISNIKNKLKLNYLFNKQKIMFSNFSTHEICAIHKTCDILLDINDKPISNIHRHLAEYYNNKVLTSDDLKKITVPSIDDPDYHPDDIKLSILTNDLIQKMRDIVVSEGSRQKYISQSTISQILC